MAAVFVAVTAMPTAALNANFALLWPSCRMLHGGDAGCFGTRRQHCVGTQRQRSLAVTSCAASGFGGARKGKLKLGVYTTKTKIRIRREPDPRSERTGEVLHSGQLFDATEVVQPAKPRGRGFLKVEDRGWVFDKGVAGNWKGKSIVTRLPEDEQKAMRSLFDDPEALAEYYEIMAKPDYKERVQEKVQEATSKTLEAEIGVERTKNLRKCMENLQALTDGHDSFDRAMDDPKVQEAVADVMAQATGDPKTQSLLQGKLGWTVAPRWMRLANDEDLRELSAKFKKQDLRHTIKELPGGDDSLRWRPRTMARRFGIRVPTVNTPI